MMLSLANLSVCVVCEPVLYDWDREFQGYKGHFRLRTLSHLVAQGGLPKHRLKPCSVCYEKHRGNTERSIPCEKQVFFSQPDLMHELDLVGSGSCICCVDWTLGNGNGWVLICLGNVMETGKWES